MTYTTKIEHDDISGAPWENCEGHGLVSGWTRRDKHPGEWVLSTNKESRRYYDYAGTLALARRDGWGLSPEVLADQAHQLGRPLTSKEVTAAAVTRDFEYLRAWCNDEWSYIGVIVTDDETGESASLWGIGSNAGGYIREVEDELKAELQHRYSIAHRFEQAMACGV